MYPSLSKGFYLQRRYLKITTILSETQRSYIHTFVFTTTLYRTEHLSISIVAAFISALDIYKTHINKTKVNFKSMQIQWRNVYNLKYSKSFFLISSTEPKCTGERNVKVTRINASFAARERHKSHNLNVNW